MTATATEAPPLGDTKAIVPTLPGLDAGELERSYRHCRQLTQREARNFYFGLRLTPEPRRSALFSMYAWMRRADDEADSNAIIEARRQNLERLRDQTMRAIEGNPPRNADPMWPAFSATVHSYPIDPSWLCALLDGMESDLAAGTCQTNADLRTYCYRVASTVGLTCIGIWGLRPGADPALACRLAEHRGAGFQLTNILRDFVPDYDANPRRVYLPADSFDAASLTPPRLRSWTEPRRCAKFIQGWASAARAEYRKSEGLENLIAPDCVPVLITMTRIYGGILEMVEADPSRIVRGRRLSLPRVRKARIALAAALGRRTGIRG